MKYREYRCVMYNWNINNTSKVPGIVKLQLIFNPPPRSEPVEGNLVSSPEIVCVPHLKLD